MIGNTFVILAFFLFVRSTGFIITAFVQLSAFMHVFTTLLVAIARTRLVFTALVTFVFSLGTSASWLVTFLDTVTYAIDTATFTWLRLHIVAIILSTSLVTITDTKFVGAARKVVFF